MSANIPIPKPSTLHSLPNFLNYLFIVFKNAIQFNSTAICKVCKKGSLEPKRFPTVFCFPPRLRQCNKHNDTAVHVFQKTGGQKRTHFLLNTSASTLYFFAFNISTSFLLQHIIVCNNRAIHTLYIFSILRIVWKFFHMRRALLSPIMMLPLNLCFLAQLLNCGGAPPYFVDMSVDEPTVVRAPPPDRFPGVGSSKYLPQVSISKRGSCQIYFPG